MPFLADLSGSAVDHYFRRLLEDYLKDKEQLKCGAAFTLTHAHTHTHTHMHLVEATCGTSFALPHAPCHISGIRQQVARGCP